MGCPQAPEQAYLESATPEDVALEVEYLVGGRSIRSMARIQKDVAGLGKHHRHTARLGCLLRHSWVPAVCDCQ